MQTADMRTARAPWSDRAGRLRRAMLTLALGGLSSLGSAWAQSAVLATPEEAGRVQAARAALATHEKTWLDEIAAIEAETTILQKREELDTRIIEAQTRVLQKREELESLVRETTAEMLAHLPTVIAIIGVEGSYQSQIRYPSGRKAYVRVGDQISPDVKVVAISISGVDVDVTLGRKREQRRVPLNFIGLAERSKDPDGSNIREQIEATKNVVLPGARARATQAAGGEAAAVVNILRALADGQASP